MLDAGNKYSFILESEHFELKPEAIWKQYVNMWTPMYDAFSAYVDIDATDHAWFPPAVLFE